MFLFGKQLEEKYLDKNKLKDLIKKNGGKFDKEIYKQALDLDGLNRYIKERNSKLTNMLVGAKDKKAKLIEIVKQSTGEAPDFTKPGWHKLLTTVSWAKTMDGAINQKDPVDVKEDGGKIEIIIDTKKDKDNTPYGQGSVDDMFKF